MDTEPAEPAQLGCRAAQASGRAGRDPDVTRRLHRESGVQDTEPWPARLVVPNAHRFDAHGDAAGDVANQLHPFFGRARVEHYNNAEKMGQAAARSMLGSTDPYDYLHTFWSDQYEHKLEYVGHAAEWDEFLVRGSLEQAKLIGFYMREGLIAAAAGLDRGGDPEADTDGEMAACARLVATRARHDPDRLTDEGVDLWSLAEESGSPAS